MKQLGSTFFYFGVGSTALHFINMEFILLSWIDLWGPMIGWAIRGALIVVGGFLWFLGSKSESS